ELSKVVGEIDGVVAGVDTWDEAVFQLAPKLKVIARFGVGVDNIDCAAATRHNVVVTNAAGGNSNAVAELTVGLIISAMRAIVPLHNSTRQGAWDRFVGTEIVNRTVGLLGFGNIARKVARKLSGFDARIIAYDKYPNLEAAQTLGVEMVSADDVLTRSDIVCTLLPSLPETKHFMNSETFGKMKDGSYFVNTARGALVDEAALADALTSGKLRGAAVDVYEKEPVLKDNPLLKLDNLVTTPHTAAETYETYTLVGRITAEAVLDVLNGRSPANQLNKVS
ncbi:MAG: phosphoglycerate dehydrogenase, partial [Methylobacteriaceae bacterium]|nr:phosphoglycerate dehydrogenase [Methylobacteriaceae bacterium]